jgi:lysophospholipase L1-like esterase
VFSGLLGSRRLRLALYVLASGFALPLGLGLIAAGALGRLRWPRTGLGVAVGGLALALASAVPVGRVLYGLLIGVFGVWSVLGATRERAQRAALVPLLAIAATVQVSSLLPASPTPEPSDTLPVFVLGDSLSAGFGSDLKTWPDILAERTGRAITNLAHPGSRLRDGLRQAELLPSGDCLLIIELGGNDLLGGATVNEFHRDLTALLRHVTQLGRTIAMFELPLLPLQNRYGEAQREVSSRLGVLLIPRRVLAGAVALPDHTTDGLHLSAEGHRWLASRVASWI